MALIPIQHTNLIDVNVEPNHFSASDLNPIYQGMVVKLDTNGYVKRYGGIVTENMPLGLAADTLAQDKGHSALSADVVINPAGSTRSTSNRVSDFFNETLASGKMGVFIGSGEFYTDQYATSGGANYAPGTIIYAQASTGKVIDSSAGSAHRIGYVTAAPDDIPSGVPGAPDADGDGAVNGSTSLGTYLRFVLNIGK